jgi:hypothetical protein
VNYRSIHPLGTVSKKLTVGGFGAPVLALSYWILCASDTLLSLGSTAATTMKVVGYVVMLFALALRPRFHRLMALMLPLIVIFLLGLTRSFNIAAGMDELLRFLFPIVITISIYAYRDRLSTLISSLLMIAITNDLFQCYVYLSYFSGLPALLPIRIDSGVMLRAQGWVGFFSEFAFINFCSFIVLQKFGQGVRSIWLSRIFIAFSVLAFSLKLVVALVIYPLLTRSWSTRLKVLLGGAVVILICAQTDLFGSYLDVTQTKIALYLTEGNSARAESYRVLVESIMGGNFLGEGLGGFGGPASTTYGSPLYSKYHFNWFGLYGLIKTTDTFYPHLFVELGLVGGFFWLYFMLFYGQGKVRGVLWLYVVFAFCFDNLFSMGFVSPAYVFSALIAMYALSRVEVEK